FHLVDGHDDGAQIPLGRRVLERRGALLALKQELDAAQAALDLPDARDDAHRVEDVRRGFVSVVALGHGKDESLGFERGLDGAQGPRPAGMGAVRPGKMTVPRNGSTGRVWRVAMRNFRK